MFPWPIQCFVGLSQVLYVRNKMDETGVDMMVDVHGDEEIPYNFINGECKYQTRISNSYVTT